MTYDVILRVAGFQAERRISQSTFAREPTMNHCESLYDCPPLAPSVRMIVRIHPKFGHQAEPPSSAFFMLPAIPGDFNAASRWNDGKAKNEYVQQFWPG
jgi:hypothetical protein